MLRRQLPGIALLLGLLAMSAGGRSLFRSRADRLADRMIAEAPSLIRPIPGQEISPGQIAWFQALGKTGRRRDGERMARAIVGLDGRSRALASLANGLFEGQDPAQALAVARTIPDPSTRDMTLRIVALGFAFPGADGGPGLPSMVGPLGPTGGMKAVDTAASVDDPASRDAGLVDTARTLGLMQDDGAARAAAARISDPEDRDQAEADRAWTLALRGRVGPAIEAAEAVVDPARRVQALTSVAGLMADRSRVVEAGADATSNLAGTPTDREALAAGAVRAAERAVEVAGAAGVPPDGARASLATVLAEVGRPGPARIAVARIGDPDRRGQILERMVKSLVQGGEAPEALEMARAIPDPRTRSASLTNLLLAMAAASGEGKPGAAHPVAETSAALLAAAGAVADPAERAEAYQAGSHALAEAGRSGEAVRAADEARASSLRVEDRERRAYALADAAGARAKAEPGPRSAEAAREALIASASDPRSSPYHDDGPIARAARALVKALPAEAAVDLASTIDDPATRANALAALADTLGGWGWDGRVGPAAIAAERALAASMSVADPGDRADSIATVVEVVGRADRVAEALAAARSIPDDHPGPRSRALLTIAGIEADRSRFDHAHEVAAGCTPADKLAAFAAILEGQASREPGRRFARR